MGSCEAMFELQSSFKEKNNNNKYVSPFFILSFNKCLLYSHFLFLFFFVRDNNFTARGNANYGGCMVGSLFSPGDYFWGFYFFGFQVGVFAGLYRYL